MTFLEFFGAFCTMGLAGGTLYMVAVTYVRTKDFTQVPAHHSDPVDLVEDCEEDFEWDDEEDDEEYEIIAETTGETPCWHPSLMRIDRLDAEIQRLKTEVANLREGDPE